MFHITWTDRYDNTAHSVKVRTSFTVDSMLKTLDADPDRYREVRVRWHSPTINVPILKLTNR